jgi:hypothetical protein
VQFVAVHLSLLVPVSALLRASPKYEYTYIDVLYGISVLPPAAGLGLDKSFQYRDCHPLVKRYLNFQHLRMQLLGCKLLPLRHSRRKNGPFRIRNLHHLLDITRLTKRNIARQKSIGSVLIPSYSFSLVKRPMQLERSLSA